VGQAVGRIFFAQYNPNDINKKEHERIFFQTNELLIDIASSFFVYGKFKDKWDTSKCNLNYSGQNLLLKSEKMDITFNWSLAGNEFYMDSFIMYPGSLRYMTDDFWSVFIELKGLGKFKYFGSGHLNGQKR